MGTVIDLEERRRRRQVPAVRDASRTRPPSRPVFAFDLNCPFSYLAAEQIDAGALDACWLPASAAAVTRASTERSARARLVAEERADALGLTLAWPAGDAAGARTAMRAAHYAAERGRAASFALAAGRLAFCGGFHLDDPEILTEAAAAAGLGLAGTLAAAGDFSRDGALEAAGRRLLALGADRLPALVTGRILYAGERRVAAAVAASAHRLAAGR